MIPASKVGAIGGGEVGALPGAAQTAGPLFGLGQVGGLEPGLPGEKVGVTRSGGRGGCPSPGEKVGVAPPGAASGAPYDSTVGRSPITPGAGARSGFASVEGSALAARNDARNSAIVR